MRRFTSICLLIFAFAGVGSEPVSAQAVDPDELFKEARTAAFDAKDYDRAITLSLQVLSIVPDYHEVREFLGRVYYWDGQNTNAKIVLNEVLSSEPSRTLARSSLADIYLEEQSYQRAIALLDEGLRTSPANVDFLFKKGLALEQINNPRDAVALYRRVQKLQPTHPFVGDRLQNLGANALNWVAGSGFSYTGFSNGIDPWTIGTVNVTRKTGNGDFTLTANYGSRFGLVDQEIELSGYPVFSEKLYGFASFAVSSNEFFPEYRAAVSIFRAFPQRTEVEVGFRFLSFKALDVPIYTLSISKYATRYRFSARSFYSVTSENTTFTALLSGRRFFNNTNTFLELRAGYGSTNNQFNNQVNVDRLTSFEVSGIFQKELARRILLTLEFGFFNEEFASAATRERYQSLIGLQYAF